MGTPNREEQLRRLVVELQLMQGSVETLQTRHQILQAAIADLRVANSSLNALKEIEKGTPILVPAGGGAFVNAVLGDMDRVIVGVGADVSIEMGLGEALEDVSSRLEDVEKASQSVQQQLAQILAQMQAHQDMVNRLSAQLRGDKPSV